MQAYFPGGIFCVRNLFYSQVKINNESPGLYHADDNFRLSIAWMSHYNCLTRIV